MQILLNSESRFQNFTLDPFAFHDLSEEEFSALRLLILSLTSNNGTIHGPEKEFKNVVDIYSALFYALQKQNPLMSDFVLHQELKNKLLSYWVLSSELFHNKEINLAKFYSYYCEEAGVHGYKYNGERSSFLLAPGKNSKDLEKENDSRTRESYLLPNYSAHSSQELIEFLLHLNLNESWIANSISDNYFKDTYSGNEKKIYFSFQEKIWNYYEARWGNSYSNVKPIWERKNLFPKFRISNLKKEIVPFYKEYQTRDLKCKIVSEFHVIVYLDLQVSEKYVEKLTQEIDGKQFWRQEEKERIIMDWTPVLNSEQERKEFVFKLPIIEKTPLFLK